MPTATRDELSTLKLLGEWKQFARDEVDTIGGWRECDTKRLMEDHHKIWSRQRSVDGLPWHFNSQTVWLVGYIVEQYPKLDPAPINAVCDAVMTWYKDRDAQRIPEQRVLETTLENALRVVCTAQFVVDKRIHERNGAWWDRIIIPVEPGGDTRVRLDDNVATLGTPATTMLRLLVDAKGSAVKGTIIEKACGERASKMKNKFPEWIWKKIKLPGKSGRGVHLLP